MGLRDILASRDLPGDVFTDVPLVLVDENGDTVRAETNGMVISSTCDAQPSQGETLLVAPVIDLKDYLSNAELTGQQLQNHIDALTANKLSEIMFYQTGTESRVRSWISEGSARFQSSTSTRNGARND